MTLNYKILNRLFAGFLLVTFYTSVPIRAADALPTKSQIAEKIENFTDQGPLVESMIDGHRIIDAMHKHANQLNDYALVFEMTVFKKHALINERGNLYFKKPGLLRLEETGQYQKGSVAVIGRDGRAHGHLGGMAKFITLHMDPDDKMLRAANGDSMKDSDFASLGEHLKNLLKEGVQSRVTEKPTTVKGVAQPAYVLELFRPENKSQVLKRIWVDSVTYLPVRWDDYDFKDPSASTWRNIKSNVGLSDDLFSL